MKTKKIYLHQYKPGYRLAEHVLTSFGNVLFKEGYVLAKKDIDVLHAFLVPHIVIEAKANLEKSEVEEEENNHLDQVFTDIYSILLLETEKLFIQLKNKAPISAYTIVKNLVPFIEYGLNHSTSLILEFTKLIKMEKYMYHHSLLVSLLVGLIANRSGMDKKRVFEAALSGYVHNIGQTLIDEHILNKPGALTEEEYLVVQKHTQYSYNLLKELPNMPYEVLVAVAQHHEREDGSGYPNGLVSKDIHDYAKIIAIADIYVAMSSNKLYRKAYSPFIIAEQIKYESFGKLDATYVHHFLELISSTLDVGKKVTLNNGWVGKIIYLDPNAITRPMVNCAEQIVNLQQQKDLYIEQVM